jgi:ethanolamine utilization protein EutN
VYIARIDGTLTSTVKHASLAGARLLIGQRIGAKGEEVGEPQVLVDPIGARRGNRVVVTTDGDHARTLLGDPRTPVRLVVLGIVDETFVPSHGGA